MREFRLLEHIYRRNAGLNALVRIPSGDDMGMVRIGGSDVLVAVDQVVAGRHFDPAVTPIEKIGYKAVARSLSDIAAMAAKPVASLAAVALPRDFTEDKATALFDVMAETAERFHCPLIGGDISIHSDDDDPLVCAITILARPVDSDHPPRRRSDARVGDGVFVTGVLGGSMQEDGLGHHLQFEPRVDDALELYQMIGDHLHAMIDISDGLGRDLSHIARASNVCIEIDAERIPCRDGVDWKRAASDGEDYELAFTADAEPPHSIGDLPVTRIGQVVAPEKEHTIGRVIARCGRESHDISEHGWQHQA